MRLLYLCVVIFLCHTSTIVFAQVPSTPTWSNPWIGCKPDEDATISVTVFSSAENTGGTAVRWYKQASGGSLFAVGNSVTESIANTTTYYAASWHSTKGESPTRLPVTATVLHPPTVAPTVTGNVIIGPGRPMTLTAHGVPANFYYDWFTPPASWGIDYADYPTTSPAQTTANFIYVRFTSPNCAGVATPVTVTVYPFPYIEGAVIGPDGKAILTCNTGYDTYAWFEISNPAAILKSSSDNTFAAPEHGTYRVTVFKAGVQATSEPYKVSTQTGLQDVNQVVTQTVLVAGTTTLSAVDQLDRNGKTRSIAFFDALGRPMQTVVTQNSPLGLDVVQPFAYDKFGREDRKYLPTVTVTTDGGYKANIIDANGNYAQTAAVNPYNNGAADKVSDDAKPYALTLFEPSPLNRVAQQGMPGTAWQPNPSSTYNNPVASDHSIKKSYDANADNEVLRWTYTSSSTYPLGLVNTGAGSTPAYYSANQLTRSRTKDEHQREVIEYADKDGRTLLKRVQAVAGTVSPADANKDTNYASTYYIYDDFGNLVCAIPPEATARLATEYYNATDAAKDQFLARWAYRYSYDTRQRNVKKQMPGAAPVHMIYDYRDRLAMTQDGNQRLKRQWLFTKYDNRDRVIMTGLIKWKSGSTPESIQYEMINVYHDPYSAWGENYVGAATGNVHGYSNISFPLTDTLQNYLTVTYYDDYRFKTLFNAASFNYKNNELPADAQNTAQASSENTLVKGMITGSKVRLLSDGSWLKTATYYDKKYRTIQQIAENVKGYIISTNVYDFVGKVKRTRSSLYTGQTAPLSSFVKRFVYDHAGRLLDTWHAQDGAQEILLSHNSYNELGQVVTKALHKEQNGTPVQSIDYRYNIRGWLTSVNNAELAVDAANDNTGDFFGMNLDYTAGELGATPQYNGNIGNIRWSKDLAAGRVTQNAHGYAYDAMNRLSASQFRTKNTAGWQTLSNSRFAETNITYDLNGNILFLNRNDGRTGTDMMDKLVYTYGQGNKLANVKDNGDVLKGFADGNISASTSVDDFTYDDNGNMLTDRNKGISTPITYNYMNLPEHVVKASNSIDYVYDAAGIKHAQRVSGTQLAMTTEYAGPWIFQNNQLQFLQHKEGRIIMAKRTLLYKNTGDDLETVSATAGATLAKQTINGETYIKITESAGQPAKTGLTEIGGSIPVSAGDRILYRVKAYHPSAGHSLYVGGATTTGGTLTDVLWRGAALQAGATNEAWVENIVVVPAGKVELAFGILTEAASGSGATAYVNEIEIYKLETSAPEYQYDLKDHLGNVRVTFTTKTTNGQFTAGFETASQATEASIFENYPAGAQINTQPEHAHTGNNSHWMNGGYAGQVGVAKSMAVMPGDQVKIEAFATYGAETNTPTDFSSFVPLLLSAFNLPAPAAGELGTASSAISAFGTWEMGPTGDASHDDPVKGFVTIVLFDRDYNFLDVAYKPAGNSGDLISQTYTVKEPGYAYLYVSNENPTRRDIYFDDVRITHTPSLIIQREDYYPFGLTFNAYNRENSVPQNYKYNGKEEQTALGLGWLDYGARMYQPELGRFFTQDKFASKSVDASPYSYGLNNPALYVDINGDSVWTTTQTHTDANGNVTVTNTINITGKVLRQSSGTAKAQEVATGLNARLNAQKDTSGPKKNADGTTTTTITKINANFTAASSMSDVSSKDHLVVIVDNVTGKADPKLGGGEAGGLAVLGGQIAYVENAGAVESAFHEVGHNLGMEHPDSNNGNPMSYNGSGNNFSSLQMMQTYNRARNGALNQGSNSAVMGTQFPDIPFGEFVSPTTTQSRPFMVGPDKRARIPLPLINQ